MILTRISLGCQAMAGRDDCRRSGIGVAQWIRPLEDIGHGDLPDFAAAKRLCQKRNIQVVEGIRRSINVARRSQKAKESLLQTGAPGLQVRCGSRGDVKRVAEPVEDALDESRRDCALSGKAWARFTARLGPQRLGSATRPGYSDMESDPDGPAPDTDKQIVGHVRRLDSIAYPTRDAGANAASSTSCVVTGFIVTTWVHRGVKLRRTCG